MIGKGQGQGKSVEEKLRMYQEWQGQVDRQEKEGKQT